MDDIALDRSWPAAHLVSCHWFNCYLTSANECIGNVYAAQDIITDENVVAKFERVVGKSSYLKHEAGIYKKFTGAVGIPALLWYGPEAGSNVLVLEHLGPSL